jgi:hypothetical protein
MLSILENNSNKNKKELFMKQLFLILSLISAQVFASDCKPTGTQGQSIRTILEGSTLGGDGALNEFSKLSRTNKVEDVNDELGKLQYQQVQEVVSDQSINVTGQNPEGYAEETARLVQYCSGAIGGGNWSEEDHLQNVHCALICYQNSYYSENH